LGISERKKNMRKLTIFILLLTLSSWANAQDWYASVNLSRSVSTSENMKPLDIFVGYPGINFSVGNNFNRFWGLRLSAGFNPQQGRASSSHEDTFPDDMGNGYKFLSVTGYADAMINLTELFLEPQLYRTDALYLVVGAGAIRTGKFSKKLHSGDKENPNNWEKYYPVRTNGRLLPVARIGLAGSLMLTRSLDLGAEIKYNFVSDEYNGVKHGGPLDGYVDVNIGINWFFSRRHLQRTEIPSLPYEIMAEAQTERFVAGQRMQNGISFYFDFSDLNSKQWPYVEQVAQLLKNNPSARVVIHGYADKDYSDESYVAYNEKLAAARAQAVYDRLVNTHSISADRLSISTHAKSLEGYKQDGEWIRAVEFEMTK